MFKTDQKEISDFAKASPENTARVIKFVLLTIQRHFYQVKPLMTGELKMNYMGLTKRGIAYAEDNKLELYNTLFAPGLTDRERFLGILAVPGLALAKTGFVLQLCLGKAGCLDSHNLKRFGLKSTTLSKSLPTLFKQIDEYLRTCERLGGAEYLWDSWCELIADKYPEEFTDTEDVSRDHVRAIIF